MKPAIRSRVIFSIQVCSLLGIWVLLLGIVYWLGRAIYNAVHLDDVVNATVVITIVAMIVFIVLVSVLTYVFIGIQLGREKDVVDRSENAVGEPSP